MARFTDDPELDFLRHDAEQTEELERLPTCEDCGELITDEYLFDVDGDILCRGCMESRYERSVERYMR